MYQIRGNKQQTYQMLTPENLNLEQGMDEVVGQLHGQPKKWKGYAIKGIK